MVRFILRDGMLPPRERELVILRVGWRCGSEYEFGHHTLLGLGAGLTEDEVGLLCLAQSDHWAAEDRALIDFVDELCRADVVSEPTWRRLAHLWSEPELLELLAVAGFYRLVSGLLNSVQVQREPGSRGWPAGRAP